MDDFIKLTVEKHPKLEHNQNVGGGHRIHNGLFTGSVWVHARPRLGVFTIETTGEALSILNNELTRRFGRYLSENSKGYKLWHIEDRKDLEEIIAFWGNM